MNESKFDGLKLENQICFPLYAAAREVVKLYRPFLSAIDLTYTQYITMMVLWEHNKVTAKDLGKKLYLDSGTLTPVLKSLEEKGFVHRQRSTLDERVLLVDITEAGKALKEQAAEIPEKVACALKLSKDEATQLYNLLYTLLGAND